MTTQIEDAGDVDTAPTDDSAAITADGERSSRWLSAVTTGQAVERFLSFLSPLLALGLWEMASRQGWIDIRFFPPPTQVAAGMWDMVRNGELLNCKGLPGEASWCAGDDKAPDYGHLGISLFRITAGYWIGVVPALVLGITMGLSSKVRAFFSPLVDALFPIPKIALLPMMIIIFGLGEKSKIAIIAFAVFFVVLINTTAGVRHIPAIYRDVGRNFHAGKWMMLRDIALPGALPSIITGLRLAAGIALFTIVAAEFVGARSGIGYLIWTSWQVFQVEDMYIGLLIVAGLGYVTARALTALQRRFVSWSVTDE